MNTFFWILIMIITFCFMEIVAWATHKYIMHGFLWVLHKDHHKKDHDSWFERNDLFFLQFAGISAIFVVLWGEYDIWYGLPIAIGIFFYGLAYFIVHDIFIHRRFKIFKNINHWYARGIRKGHKVHHKHLGKEDGECFGMLWVPKKYFKQMTS